MKAKAQLSRRTILYSAAAAAGAVALSACADDGNGTGGGGNGNGGGGAPKGKGSAAEPMDPPSEYKEAPMLADLVEAGELDPVEERLPENPYVIPHNWFEEGNYGGRLLMICAGTQGELAHRNRQYMYGHSPLRWLNDGLDVGPGLVESWEVNDDASEWTFQFRKGLKWSDGKPWTTADIMFWWEDICLNEDHPQVPPDEARSGTGKLAEFSAPDESTLVMTFDAPAPLTGDRMAMWVNGAVGRNGPIWMLPRHYVEEFHPKYNPDAPDNWAAVGGPMESMSDFANNPECPTMTGWRLKEHNQGTSLEWERNPYYWCVSPDGAQLPYIDTITMSEVQDVEVGKLQVRDGDVDFWMGSHFSETLEDVSGMMESRERAGTEVLLWDSGSGTGAVTFFNYDYPDEKLREIFREPTFRQALSHAFNRDEAQKSIYFELGEQTTGTLSPKAIEYQVNDEGKQVYADWRDSYIAYDVDKANQLLDDLGLEDVDGDGFRELPDGSKLELSLDYNSDATPDHLAKDELLRQSWGEVGIKATANPVPVESLRDQWTSGSLMIRSGWEVGDGPNHLVFPQWLVPIEPERWAPLEGQWYNLRGTPQAKEQLDLEPFKRTPPRMEPEADGPIAQIWELYDQSKVEPDELERHRIVWEIIKLHIEFGPFFMGSVANPPRTVVAKTDLRNVPHPENLALNGFVNPWIHPTPAVYDPEAFYWEDPSQHEA